MISILLELIKRMNIHDKKNTMAIIAVVISGCCLVQINSVGLNVSNVVNDVSTIKSEMTEVKAALYWKLNINPHLPKSASISNQMVNFVATKAEVKAVNN